MDRKLQLAVLIIVAVAAAVAGWWLAEQRRDTGPRTPSVSQAERPAATTPVVESVDVLELPDAAGRMRRLGEWSGKVRLINFWATWCPPCRDEIPLLIDAQERYQDQGLQVIGISMDTDLDALARFSEDMGIDYPMLVGEIAAVEAAEAMGADFIGLPFSVLVDRDGAVLSVHIGELHADELDELVRPAL